MTDKKPFWKDGILWVWCDCYHSYIANYCHSRSINNGICWGEKINE